MFGNENSSVREETLLLIESARRRRHLWPEQIRVFRPPDVNFGATRYEEVMNIIGAADRFA